ncbi:MAG: 2-phosphosulfolactate phosphatase [Bacteroidales bacterium]|nr:2-phosphosulfolactate phosphatase [Bacteroidales bacterium]
MMKGPVADVCFSPALLPGFEKRTDRIVVVIDILRATTAMCTAFGFGVKSVIPVMKKETALARKEKGWLVAGEENGIRLPFADFGNSPREFRSKAMKGKEIVFCTTNGTKAILKGRSYGQLIIASFVNLEAVCTYIKEQKRDVLILCAGWKDRFSLEDSVAAGALADRLIHAYGYLPGNDAALAAISLWNQASKSLLKTVFRSDHYLRLLGIEDRKGLRYCFFPEKFRVVPGLQTNKLINLPEIKE